MERGLRVEFLLDGDGGGEAVHEVDVGLLDAFEELAGVGGEGFDVAALALGVDGVEGERGLAGAADAADDGEGVVRDVDVDGLEVVGARAADGDGVAGDEDDARRVGLAGLRLFAVDRLLNHGHSPLSDSWAGIANRGWK